MAQVPACITTACLRRSQLCCCVVLLLQYVEALSNVPWQNFSGGRYKASTNSTLTSTTIAGALTELKPGGIRELHWHNAVEWAMVIRGTCM
jgi:oxalate decarboxylase/phosphoglucose isomerase-like protein (cupin superfamily)